MKHASSFGRNVYNAWLPKYTGIPADLFARSGSPTRIIRSSAAMCSWPAAFRSSAWIRAHLWPRSLRAAVLGQGSRAGGAERRGDLPMDSGMSGPDFIVEIDGVDTPGDDPEQTDSNGLCGRPWLAVHWRCCNMYSRVYRDRSGSFYEGRCPRCQRAARATIGPGGTKARFFTAR